MLTPLELINRIAQLVPPPRTHRHRYASARGPPLWEGEGTPEAGEGVEALPDWDLANQSAPDYTDDQRTTW